MANSESVPDEKIFLSAESLEVFKITDPKEKIDALKATFFPPLEFLVEYSLNLIREIYGIEPNETMTKVYKPSNRKDAEVNTVFDVAYVGISGQRRNSKKDNPLSYTNRNGKNIYIHPTYLTFDIYASGVIVVSFFPFRNSVDARFALQVCRIIREHLDALNEIFEKVGILHSSTFSNYSTDFRSLFQDKNFNPRNERDIHAIELHSYAYDLPLNHQSSWELIQVFAAFYPLLDTFIKIGDGEEPCLAQMLEQFNSYLNDEFQPESEDTEKLDDLSTLSENYPQQVEPKIESLDSVRKTNCEQETGFPESFEDARQRVEASVVSRPGQATFRQKLIEAYDRHCVITDCDAEAALEAAHIVPYLGEETNHPANGLLLRGDIHSLFDRHLLSINPDTYLVEIASALRNTCYGSFHGKLIRFPKEKVFKPAQNALRQHYIKFLNRQET